MWEKLIRRRDLKRSGVELDQIEDPFFAVGRVRRYLEGYEQLPGLDELMSEFCGRGQSRRSIPEPQARRMFEAVERGDWLLVLDKPVLPLSRDSANRWWAITGKRVLESVYHPPRAPEKPSLSWAEYTPTRPKPDPVQKQYRCTFTKPRTLPDGAIDFTAFGGPVPTCGVAEYGTFALLGGDESNPTGNIVLKQIRGNPLPAALGTLALGGTAAATAGVSCGGLCGAGAVASTVGASALAGLVGLLWPSSLGDSSLYTDEQLDSLKQGRTRVRLHIEQQADGTLRGYGYNTQQRPDWEMIPVVQFRARGAEQVADFGDGVTLIWAPAVDPSATSGIPPLEGGPQAPKIWIYPPTEQADNLIVNPIHPPEYKDFILVFPVGSGVRPLYVVMNVRRQPGVVTGRGEDVEGGWLAWAGKGLGAPIPTRIADKLRGKTFSSFDAFRKAFWIAVGNDGELSGQLNQVARDRLSTGNAPVVRDKDSVGGRGTYEMHHVERITDGGAVYDVDNLRVNTPRNHIDLHRSY
ncbi:S-type pyocin domain-containing protein [Pseudomonas sp. Marseille-Q1929]|uniref:S-type pyocin domain-containing protein n=1 Tax=Pseudomonas sp. Marseille-Q1929 TaxID=2730402 RepID=UPI001A8EAE4A|nr:S-type pyocin domain-containing protein [Pseudomonas sp. Marseille-Q1929]MBO0495583.1 S-type pyocin domain-containing protein [Pseudomonas sp. Marseille-Q1929]